MIVLPVWLAVLVFKSLEPEKYRSTSCESTRSANRERSPYIRGHGSITCRLPTRGRVGQLSSARCNHLGGDALQGIVLGTNVTLLHLASALPNRYVKSGVSKNQGMLSLTDRKSGRCARWCALVVLTAIFALTISVATRYGSAEGASTSAVKTSHNYSSQPPGRQRLTKDAANWVPPTIDCVALQAPARPARIPSVGSAIPNPSFASSLYYRPPPIFSSFS
jgi:hypothetical protein